MDEMEDPESMDQEDIEIRALRMRAMESNADEDVSYVVDADALNNAQDHDTAMSDVQEGTLAIIDGLEKPAETNNNNELIPITDTQENILQTALLVNKDYQDLLQNQMNYILAEIEKNKELQKRYKAILEKNSRPQRRAPVNNIGKRAPGFPYFTDQDGQKPPDNSDITDLKPEFEKTAYAFKFRKWSKQEIQALTQNVRKQNSDSRFQSLIEDLEANKISTDDFAVRSEELHNTPDAEFEVASVEDVRWDEIASNIGNRTAADCKMTWINSESPRINKDPWTKDEDNTLVKLVKKYKGFRWEAIANELNTHRVAVQCIRRYQRNLNTGIMKTTWSADEDRQLAEAVKKFGESNWQQVANSMEGRTGQQCLHRWDKTLKPTIKKGRWNAEEDKMLIDAVNQIGEGKGWTKVSKLVPGRTDMQCRERWVNVLSPKLNHTPWSAEEDERLAQGIGMYLFYLLVLLFGPQRYT